MTDILKDSRIGTYGAAALIFSICLRWQLIAQVIGNPIAPLAATLTLSRASMIALAGWAPSVGAGLGREFAAGCTRSVLIAVIAQSIFVLAVAAGFIGLYRAGAMIAMTALVVWCARVYFTKRLGGVNGDCLGATCQAVEIMSLLVMAWQPSS